MSKQQMKMFGIFSLVVCAICIFVAIERYNANADAVRSMNSMQQSMPFGNMMIGGSKLEPAMPAATKYSLFFALITGIAGVIMLVKSSAGNVSCPGNSEI